MNCMYCGAAVNKGEQICPRCGEELHVQRRGAAAFGPVL